MKHGDDAVQMAMDAQTKQPIIKRIESWLDGRNPWQIVAVVVAFAVLCSLSLYEAVNAARGAALIAQAAVPKPVAFIAGAAFVLGYIVFHRRATEYWRDKKAGSCFASVLAALVCACLALFCVFSNLASKTAVASGEATIQNQDLAALRAELTLLRSKTSDVAFTNAETLVSITRDQIQSLEAEAAGWRMRGTSPEDCAQDLRPRQRQICNELNGSDGIMGLRNELKLHEASVENLTLQRDRKAEIEKTLRQKPQLEANEHWKAISEVSLGQFDADQARIWGTFMLSVGILLVSGFGWDRFLEDREGELKKGPPDDG